MWQPGAWIGHPGDSNAVVGERGSIRTGVEAPAVLNAKAFTSVLQNQRDDRRVARQSRLVCFDPSVMTWRTGTKELRGCTEMAYCHALRAVILCRSKHPNKRRMTCEFFLQVSLAGSMRLKVTALASGHFWRRTDDGRHRCIWHRCGVRPRFFFVGNMYWPYALTKPVHIQPINCS